MSTAADIVRLLELEAPVYGSFADIEEAIDSIPAISSTVLTALGQAKSDLAHVTTTSEPLTSPTGVELAPLAGFMLPVSPPLSPPDEIAETF